MTNMKSMYIWPCCMILFLFLFSFFFVFFSLQIETLWADSVDAKETSKPIVYSFPLTNFSCRVYVFRFFVMFVVFVVCMRCIFCMFPLSFALLFRSSFRFFFFFFSFFFMRSHSAYIRTHTNTQNVQCEKPSKFSMHTNGMDCVNEILSLIIRTL